jgi:hypothetical protein
MLQATPSDLPLATAFPAAAFAITSLQEEIRADRLCHDLLRRFALELTAGGQFAPAAAGALAHGADYFLREFVIGERRENILQLHPERVRQFAGNWYIVRNLEPNLQELLAILEGVTVFYRFLAEHSLVEPALAAAVAEQAADSAYFGTRIEAFWAIESDGFGRWDRDCPVGD